MTQDQAKRFLDLSDRISVFLTLLCFAIGLIFGEMLLAVFLTIFSVIALDIVVGYVADKYLKGEYRA